MHLFHFCLGRNCIGRLDIIRNIGLLKQPLQAINLIDFTTPNGFYCELSQIHAVGSVKKTFQPKTATQDQECSLHAFLFSKPVLFTYSPAAFSINSFFTTAALISIGSNGNVSSPHLLINPSSASGTPPSSDRNLSTLICRSYLSLSSAIFPIIGEA